DGRLPPPRRKLDDGDGHGPSDGGRARELRGSVRAAVTPDRHAVRGARERLAEEVLDTRTDDALFVRGRKNDLDGADRSASPGDVRRPAPGGPSKHQRRLEQVRPYEERQRRERQRFGEHAHRVPGPFARARANASPIGPHPYCASTRARAAAACRPAATRSARRETTASAKDS